MASRTSTLSEGSLSWSKTDDSLMDAVSKRDVSKVRSVMNKKKANPTKISPHLGVAAIHQAASFDKCDILDVLLTFPSIDVNQRDARKRTALHHAVREGRDECLNRLILMNANTMLVENEGLSALHLASMLGHMGCLQLLVSTVQSIDAKDDKERTALFYAASRGSASSCRLLLEYGAHINATDNYGRTALMMTAENGHQAVFQYLLSRGANVSIRDKKGRDIRWYATNYNHTDLLLFLPHRPTIDRRSISNTSNEEDERLVPSSQRRLANKWGPELDLSRADPERTPGRQNQIHLSTTDSEQRSNSILEDEVNVRAATFVEHQATNEVDERREQEWTKERLELIRKLTDLADENKELIQWKAKAEATEQQNLDLLTRQQQIYPLMEEVYQSVETCRRQASTMEEANICYLQDASQTLTLILQAVYETNRANAESTDEVGKPFAVEMSRIDKVVSDMEGSVKEYDKEIERLKAEVRKLNDLMEGQQSVIQKQEEQLGQLQMRIRDQTVSLRRFSSVKEVLGEVTQLDDVSEDQAAEVIRQIGVEYQKLQTKYIALKAKQREVKTTSSELHLKSATTHEVLTECHSNNSTNDDDWRSKTMMHLRAMKDLSATPISDLLQEQLIVLRKSLESQIGAVQRKDDFDNKTGSRLQNPDPAMALQKLDRYTNETDEQISRGKETKEVMSKSRYDYSEPQFSRTSDGHSLDEHERIRYETEIRQLRSKIELLKLEDSGVRTISTDVEAEDESHTLLMLSRQTQSPVPDESVGILTENRRLKSELEKLRSTIKPDNGVVTYQTEQEVRTDSKGMQTDAELLKEVMLSRMVSNYEKELLEKVESLKSQNAQLRSEIETLSVQKNNEQEKHHESKALRMRNEHVGSLGAGRDARLPSARDMETRENGKRRSQQEGDSSSGESVDSNECNYRGSNPCDQENAKIRKTRKAENGDKRGIRDFDGRRSSQSSLSEISCSSDEENGGKTRREHDREHLAKKTSNKIVAGTGNKDRKSANTNTYDEKVIYANEIHNASSNPHDVILPGRTGDEDPALLTAEAAQKVLVKKLMNLPDSNTPPLNSRGSPVTQVKATSDIRLANVTKLEDAAIAKPSFPTHSSTPNASLAAAESNHGKRISRNGEKAKTSSTRRRESSSNDDEAFECMFQVNQDFIDPSKTVSSESTNQVKRKTKIKLLRFDAQARSKLQMDLETVIQENARLREEMSSLKTEISSLKQTTSKTAEKVDLLPSTTNVERVSKRHSVVSKGVGGRQPVASKETSAVQPVTSAGAEVVNLRRPAASDEETKSQDEGYRFLSEDENGTFTFKEFSQQTPSHFSQEEKENGASSSDAGSSDFSHSLAPSISGSTSLNSTDEAENDVRAKHPNGRRRKREEAREGKLRRKVSNEIQQRRLNETVTLVVSNQAEPSGNWHKAPHQHLYHQQQHSSRRSGQRRISKGNRLEASNSSRDQKEILVINGGETLTDADKTQICALQKQLQESEKIYKAIIGTYRSHLLASIQGCLDSEVADALCRIVTLQGGRLLEY